MRRLKLLVLLALLGPLTGTLPIQAQENPDWSGELVWPREYSNEAGARLTMYPPQVTEWEDSQRLQALVAISFSAPEDENPSLGTFEIEAATEVDLETRLVRMTGVKIVEHSFPSLDDEKSAKLLSKLESLMPTEELIIELDRVLASMERAEVELAGVETRNQPPVIHYRRTPAILVLFDGEPIWAGVPDRDLEYAVNTNWDLFRLTRTSTYYLRHQDVWLKTDELDGPWTPAGKLPKPIRKLPKDNPNWKAARESLPGERIDARAVPEVLVSQVPSELILTNGEPQLAMVDGTDLLVVVNTDSDLFLHGPESRFYYLVSGRWFRADDLVGPWQFATHDLPGDFAEIPDDHPMADVKASVPGTAEAQEAIVLARIPQTARVKRDEATAQVTYVGEPEFKPIEGTSMAYAVNSPNDVIQVGDRYYLCLDGVWFGSEDPRGPWEVASAVPEEIYEIPPTSPVYNITYVRVYDYDPHWVTFGYTSGYFGVYFSYGCMVFGTGWYYPPYSYYGPYHRYPVYFGYPYSYGFGAYYNIYSGTYGRGATVYGPYGGMGAGARFNPATGTYSRGAAAWGPYNARGWSEAYNPRTGTYARTRQGANVYSSWGSSVAVRGNDWARTARYSNARGTVGTVRTSRGGRMVAAGGGQGGLLVGQTPSGGLFAGRDGNVYRRGDNGWERHGPDGWKPMARSLDPGQRSEAASRIRQSGVADRTAASRPSRPTLDQLDRDRARRSLGERRTGQYRDWRSRGGYRPSRGGTVGPRNMRGRAGGIRRR